ncbi:suppressor of fused domain protein [Micromonospora chersina]|uniref:suppressor of fused domain protein n=1 Tax=Micromonospora chersina TaxID=47854 RepID=UPI00371FC09F
MTVGLSRRHLGLPNGGALHQGLVMHVPTDGYPARAAGLLFQVAGEMVRRGVGLQHGQVIGPRGARFPDSQTTAMVAISPRYMPESFAVCHTESAPVVLTWLVPITTGEAEVVQKSPDGGRWSTRSRLKIRTWLTPVGQKWRWIS